MKKVVRALIRGTLSLAAFAMVPAHADIPQDYQPIVVTAPLSLRERVFDLTEAFAKSQREQKPVFLYLGAKDCPPCRDYERFLANNKEKLLPTYSQFVIVDIRTWLRGPDIKFKINDTVLSYGEFMKTIDHAQTTEIRYPSIWAITRGGQTAHWFKGAGFIENLPLHISRLEWSIRRSEREQASLPK